jgi:hypothetical protein
MQLNRRLGAKLVKKGVIFVQDNWRLSFVKASSPRPHKFSPLSQVFVTNNLFKLFSHLCLSK